MTFFLSKYLWYVFNPFNCILILFVIGLFFYFIKFSKLSKIAFLLGFISFISLGTLPIGTYLLYLLEKNYHYKVDLPDNVNGVIILSGATSPFLTKEHDQISLNGNVERLIESIFLIKKYPNAKFFFAGGSGSISHPELSHSAVAERLFSSLNIETDKIYFETKSRNTFENILFAKEVYNPKKNENWLLVTSAFHMKRAIYISEKLDLKLIAYPTDYKTAKKFTWKLSFNFLGNLSSFQFSSHEWVGIIAYYLMGRSSKIL